MNSTESKLHPGKVHRVLHTFRNCIPISLSNAVANSHGICLAPFTVATAFGRETTPAVLVYVSSFASSVRRFRANVRNLSSTPVVVVHRRHPPALRDAWRSAVFAIFCIYGNLQLLPISNLAPENCNIFDHVLRIAFVGVYGMIASTF